VTIKELTFILRDQGNSTSFQDKKKVFNDLILLVLNLVGNIHHSTETPYYLIFDFNNKVIRFNPTVLSNATNILT